MHYVNECKLLTFCAFCDQVIEIPFLTQHWITECEKREELRQCQRCKEIVHENDYEAHTVAQKCPPNPKSKPKCPLCKEGIEEEWRWKQHLVVEGCPENPRK